MFDAKDDWREPPYLDSIVHIGSCAGIRVTETIDGKPVAFVVKGSASATQIERAIKIAKEEAVG